jgi:hypothetical protein
MKKVLIFFVLSLLSSFFSQAQNTDIVRAAVEKMTARYQLDPTQVVEMERIQQRKQRNLTQLEVVKTQNPYLYISKKQSIYNGTTASTKRLLRDNQLNEFQRIQIDLRAARGKKVIEAKEKNWSKLETQTKLLEVEEQFQ